MRIEHIAGALGVDGRKAPEVSNYRVAYHTISVFLEAMSDKIVAMYCSDRSPGVGQTNTGAVAGASAASSPHPGEAPQRAPDAAENH